MATITLSLKNPYAEKSPIWATVSDGRGVNIKVYSGLTVKTKHWSRTKKYVLSSDNEASAMNEYLNTFKSDVLSVYLSAKSNGVQADSNYIKNELKPKAPEAKRTFWELWDLFLQSKKGAFKAHSFTKFKSLKLHLEDFEVSQKQKFDLDAVSQEQLEDLQTFFFDSKQLNTQSTSKYIGLFKIFLNWCVKRRFTANVDFKYFSAMRQPDSLKVIISDSELDRIRQIDLGGKEYLKNVRKLFILSCLTGLRYSDYRRINKQHLKQDSDGDFVLIIRQQKTEDFVELPLTAEAEGIVKAFMAGEVRAISNQKMNEYVKELAKLASVDEPFEIDTYRGKDKKTAIHEKYKLITTHTGRRTFATNLLNRGVPAETVMKFTGHRDYKSFSKYVNIPKKAEMRVVKNALLGSLRKSA